MIEILTNNHYEKILDLFDTSRNSIKIVSPFISVSIAEKLCDIVKKNSNIRCVFITRFYLEDMINKANSIEAIELMMDAGIEVYAVKGLHTKLYLFDTDSGILGSANFTAGGFKSNIELSLWFQDEVSIIENLHTYFDEMIEKVKQSEEGFITKELIDKVRKLYNHLFESKKGKCDTKSIFMYGASLDKKSLFSSDKAKIDEINLCASEADIINDMFKETEIREQIKIGHTIWLKFDGEGDNRIYGRFPMIEVKLNDKNVFLSNYPFKVGSIQDGDEIYLAALTKGNQGKGQPVIVGKGYLQGFSENNYVSDSWIKIYDWMERYPWYCIIKECTLLDTDVNNGIPLDLVWDALGSDTYMSSFGKNETIAAVTKKHHQKAHIRLTGNAKEFIDMKFAELEVQYGVVNYKSEL